MGRPRKNPEPQTVGGAAVISYCREAAERKYNTLLNAVEEFNATLPTLRKYHAFNSLNPLDYRKPYDVEYFADCLGAYRVRGVENDGERRSIMRAAENELANTYLYWPETFGQAKGLKMYKAELPVPFCDWISADDVNKYVRYNENTELFEVDKNAIFDDAVVFAETDGERQVIDTLDTIAKLLTRSGIAPVMLARYLQRDDRTGTVTRNTEISKVMFYQLAANV